MVFGSFKYFLVHCRCIECCTNKHFKISLWVIDSHLIGRLFHVFNVVQFNIGKNSTLTNSTLNAPHCISNDKQGICSYAGKVSMKLVYRHNVICMGHAREIHFPHQFHQCVSRSIATLTLSRCMCLTSELQEFYHAEKPGVNARRTLTARGAESQ